MIRKTLRALLRRDQFESDLDAELLHHLELHAADLVRSGLTPEAARRQARLELGSRERYKDEVRASFGLRWFDDLVHDVRYALRTLRRSPGFAITAVLSMALGVGANTIVFSVVNSLLFRPLPVQQPESLLFVNVERTTNISYPTYRDLRDRARTIDGATAYRITRIGVGDERSSEKYWGYLAAGNYFDLLGIQPAVGRFFHADDEKGPNASPFAVLSYDLWQSRFQGHPQIAGKTIRVNAAPYTVLGVASKDFRGTESAIDPALWVPMMMQPQIEGRSWLEERGNRNIFMLVRTKSGLSASAVEADLNRIASDLARDYPATDRANRLILSKPGLLGNALRAPLEQAGSAVMFLAGLTLLAACVNLAALTGARSADRVKEIALRISIGAGQARIIRQLLTESVVLTAVSGAAGGALAWIALGALGQWRPPVEVPLRLDVHPSLGLLAFSTGVSLLTGLAVGLVPAFQARKLHASEALKSSGQVRGRRWHVRDASLFAQTALCCLLVVSSLVAARGLIQVLNVRPGFNPEGVSVLGFDTVLAGYSPQQAQQFHRRALETVAQLPGVISAAYAEHVPLDGNQSNTTVFPEDAPEPRRIDQGVRAAYYNVSPGYFHAMGTRLLSGREFGWNDSPDAPIAIVNETFARRLIGTTQAVGRRYRYLNGTPIEVIGVVEDGRYFAFSEDQRPVVFRAATRNLGATLIVRSSLPESTMAGQMMRVVGALDPSLPLYGAGSLRNSMALAFLPSEIALVALGSFGVLALMLAVTGIYGLASYSVTRRFREIGIRMAIGARPGQVLRSVLGRLAIVVAAGSFVGLALGLASGQILGSIVYQASPRDPVTLAAVGAIMGAVALGSALGPIRRAISIDPVRALREE